MAKADNAKWSPEQQRRLNEFSAPRSVDVHCHRLPGLGDEPSTLDESFALGKSLVLVGMTTAIAAPHPSGSYDRLHSAGKIRVAVRQLFATRDGLGATLDVSPGKDGRSHYDPSRGADYAR